MELLDTEDTEDARVASRDRADRIENALMQNIAIDKEVPEDVVREVEVFELHTLSSAKIWEPIGFTSDFFALNHPKRHLKELRASLDSPDLAPVQSPASEESTGDRTASIGEEECVSNIFRKATLAEIKSPKHWRFAEQSWQIDLDPVQWVNANYIMDLVNVDTEEKWVYDFVDNDEPCDGQIFRRRRWIRQCVRAAEPSKDTKDPLLNVTSSERLSKTFSTLLS
ncbi:hypothetical protein JCM33374_g1033 [Metschnikowia sp. JCM 33374]|nr:hypothetical protein JCM33374_g1033 [Metschnikowia sp. JCM 33374]